MDERARAAAKARLKSFGKVLASIACLVLAARLVDRNTLGRLLSRARPEWVIAGLLVSLVTYVAQAFRWKRTAERLGLRLPFRVALSEYYLAALLNQLLPTGMGGDAARVLRHRGSHDEEDRDARMRWLFAVVLERVAGQLVLWLVIALSVPLWWQDGRAHHVALAALTLGGLFVTLFVWVQRRKLRIDAQRGLGAHLTFARRAWFEDRAWLMQLSTSLFAVLGVIAMYLCTLRALDITLSAVDFFKVAPLVLAATSLPVSFAGWGPREVASALLFSQVGLDATTGTTVSVAFGLLGLASSAPGVVVWFRR